MRNFDDILFRITRLVFLSVVLSACSPTALQGTPTDGIAAPVTSPTPQPAKTEVLPTRTSTITPDLASPKPPAISAEVVLSPENADGVVELAGWGEGYAFNVKTGRLAANGTLLVQKEIIDNLPSFSGGTVRTRFWGIPSGDLQLELIHPDGYDGLYVSPDGTRFAISQNYCHRENPKPCSLEVYTFPEDQLLLSIDSGFINTAIFSPDGRRMALSTDNDIAILDLEAGKVVRTLPNSFRFDLLDFSHDGNLLAGSQNMGDGTVRVWRTVTGEQLASLTSKAFPGGYSPSLIAFSPDDAHLAMVYGGGVELWRVSDWTEGPPWTWSDLSGISAISFPPDGRLIAAGWTDGQIALADAATGKILKNWDLHSDGTDDYISDIGFSADGKILVSVSMDQTVRFWGIQR